MGITKKAAAGAVLAGALVIGAGIGPAQAQVQNGLVNVAIGDVTVLQDVNIGIAAQIAANICGVKIGPVAVLGNAVDRSGTTRTVCETPQGPIELRQA